MDRFLRWLAIASVLVAGGAVRLAYADPPARVGRLSLIEGEVTFHDTRTRESAPATLNWPVTGGAALSTAPGARAEVRIGSTAIRLDGATDLEFVQLDDQAIRLRLAHGAVGVRVRSLDGADAFELETPQTRALLLHAGRYRFDVGRIADTTAVSAFQGGVHLAVGGAVVSVRSGQRAEVGSAGGLAVVGALADGFDDWTLGRDRRDDASRSARYVSPETTGYESLDDHGDWHDTPDYGPIWYPRAVPLGWAPYRWGRWAWIEPWGWTWIDDARWGFAPFHYGRWALVGGVWGWVPGAVVARPVYAPALVGWIGRPGLSVTVALGAVPWVGWFPLAPREVFVPAYRCSTNYVRIVNVAHVTNIVHVTNVTSVTPTRFAHRHVERAITVVPASAISNGQPVVPSAVRVRHADLAADGAASHAPPIIVSRPPRQFAGDRRPQTDARWTRHPQPIARPAFNHEPRAAAAAPAPPPSAVPVVATPPQRAERRPAFAPRVDPVRPVLPQAAPAVTTLTAAGGPMAVPHRAWVERRPAAPSAETRPEPRRDDRRVAHSAAPVSPPAVQPLAPPRSLIEPRPHLPAVRAPGASAALALPPPSPHEQRAPRPEGNRGQAPRRAAASGAEAPRR